MRVYPLVYVCKYCGKVVTRFADVQASEPAVMSVCDKASCRELAASAYRG
jgi:hypothetical protein